MWEMTVFGEDDIAPSAEEEDAMQRRLSGLMLDRDEVACVNCIVHVRSTLSLTYSIVYRYSMRQD